MSQRTLSILKTLRGALIAILWLGYVYLAFFLSIYGRFGQIDFRVYYNSAGMLLAGQNPYQGLSNYLYPPLLAQLLMPLSAFTNAESGWIIWFTLNAALILGTIALLARYAAPSQRWFIWLMPVLFWVFLEALVVGQVTILLMALFAAAWAAVKQGRPGFAGMLLALAAWLKLYPALLILYFVWKRNWRLVRSALASAVILALAQILISGITPFLEMPAVLFTLSSEGQIYLAAANASVFGFAAQLFESSTVVQPVIVSPAAYFISRVGLTLGILVVTLLATARSPKHSPDHPLDARFNLEYVLVLTAALLISPTLWVSGMPPLALVYFLIWHSRPQGKAGRFLGWFCLTACLILSIYYLFIIGYAPDPPQSGLLLSFGFYTIFATWGVAAFLLIRTRMARNSDMQPQSSVI